MIGYNKETFARDRVAAQSEDLLVREKANLAFGTEMYNIDGSSLDWALQGYFGRFNYDYDRKYLLEINARYDGSSRFPSEDRKSTCLNSSHVAISYAVFCLKKKTTCFSLVSPPRVAWRDVI